MEESSDIDKLPCSPVVYSPTHANTFFQHTIVSLLRDLQIEGYPDNKYIAHKVCTDTPYKHHSVEND